MRSTNRSRVVITVVAERIETVGNLRGQCPTRSQAWLLAWVGGEARGVPVFPREVLCGLTSERRRMIDFPPGTIKLRT